MRTISIRLPFVWIFVGHANWAGPWTPRHKPFGVKVMWRPNVTRPDGWARDRVVCARELKWCKTRYRPLAPEPVAIDGIEFLGQA